MSCRRYRHWFEGVGAPQGRPLAKRLGECPNPNPARDATLRRGCYSATDDYLRFFFRSWA